MSLLSPCTSQSSLSQLSVLSSESDGYGSDVFDSIEMVWSHTGRRNWARDSPLFIFPLGRYGWCEPNNSRNHQQSNQCSSDTRVLDSNGRLLKYYGTVTSLTKCVNLGYYSLFLSVCLSFSRLSLSTLSPSASVCLSAPLLSPLSPFSLPLLLPLQTLASPPILSTKERSYFEAKERLYEGILSCMMVLSVAFQGLWI